MASQTTTTKRKNSSLRLQEDAEPLKVMAGQSEQERRELRQAQRKLLDRVQGERAEEIASMDSTAFEEERLNNNKLFKKVRYNRELGNDGVNLASISELATKRSAQLAHSATQYSSAAIGQCLQRDYGDRRDGLWLALGRDVSALFRAPPRLEFLLGALQKPEKVRKVPQRRQRAVADDDNEETRYETVDYSQQSASRHDDRKVEEATNRRLQHLLGVLGDRGDTVDVVDLCVHPTSFHQTVENFFDLSFLVKDSKAGIQLDPNTNLPVANLTEVPEKSADKHQTIVVIGPDDVRDLAEAWKIQEPTLARNDDAG